MKTSTQTNTEVNDIICYECFEELSFEDINHDLTFNGDGPHCEKCWDRKMQEEYEKMYDFFY